MLSNLFFCPVLRHCSWLFDFRVISTDVTRESIVYTLKVELGEKSAVLCEFENESEKSVNKFTIKRFLFSTMNRAHEMSTFERTQETILFTARIYLRFLAYFLIIQFAVDSNGYKE